MISIIRDNVDDLYSETLMKLKVEFISEETRGGPVRSFPVPVMWGLTNPRNRVLINPIRDANPFFHVMEFVWMISGEPKIEWITQFSKNYGQFAQDFAGYGYRWRNALGFDQIREVINLLKRDTNTRRAVLSMWNASTDLHHNNKLLKEVPCNTQIYFRNIQGRLDMTVTNRSNDIVWGALGANVVHMTTLHELIAHGAGLELGTYRAFSTNAHMYEQIPRFNLLWEVSPHAGDYVGPCRPLLQEGEKWENFLEDCEEFIQPGRHAKGAFRTTWINEVADPIRHVFRVRDTTEAIQCSAWRKACEEWLQRRSVQAKAGQV